VRRGECNKEKVARREECNEGKAARRGECNEEKAARLSEGEDSVTEKCYQRVNISSRNP